MSQADTAKVIELIGTSDESWEDAAQQALRDADETIEDITGIEIVEQTAEVDGDRITQYRSVVHVSFPVER